MRRAPLLFAILACGVAIAGAGEAPLPLPVAKDLEASAALCRDVGGTPVTEDAVKRVDLNSDGKEDFVLDIGALRCDGAASVYGDREKAVTVYAGDGKDGATAAFTDFTYGAKVEGTGSAAKVWLTVSGGQCGRRPAASFASESFCDRPLLWNPATGKFEYAPAAAARQIE